MRNACREGSSLGIRRGDEGALAMERWNDRDSAMPERGCSGRVRGDPAAASVVMILSYPSIRAIAACRVATSCKMGPEGFPG